MTTKGTKSKEQFVSRWGNPIADDYQYCEVPGYILRNYHACVSENDVYDDDGNLITKRGQVVDLGMIDMMFVIHVMAFKYDTSRGSASPSLPTIASYAGVHVSNVRRIKKRLEQYGLMTVISNPGHTDVYEFRGLHEQCVRLEQGKTPIEGVEVTPSKNTRGSKNTRATPSKNTRTPLVKILPEDIEASKGKKKKTLSPQKTAAGSKSPNPYLDTIAAQFGIPRNAGMLQSMASMLGGRARKGDWGKYRVEPGMNVADVEQFGTWYRKANPGLSMPTKPETLQKYVYQWRESLQTPQPAAVTDTTWYDPATDTTATWDIENQVWVYTKGQKAS